MFGTLLHLWTTVKIIIYPNSLHLFTVQSLRHPWLNTQSPNIDTPVQCTRVTFVEKSIHSFLNCLLGFLYIGYKSRQGMSQQLWQIFSPFHYTVLYIQKQRSLRLRNGWPPSLCGRRGLFLYHCGCHGVQQFSGSRLSNFLLGDRQGKKSFLSSKSF